MGYSTTIRQRFENLLTGATGTTHTMVAGRFHLDAEDDQNYASTAERRVDVKLGIGVPIPGTSMNQIDSFVLREHVATITVEYERTHAGGDSAEGLTEQHGPGTDDAITDRMTLDAHDIENVLGWHENWSSLDPAVFLVKPFEPIPRVDWKPQTARMVLLYRVWVQATVTGSYGS